MERNIKIAATIVALIIIAGIVYYVAPPATAAENITIGHIGPLTGFMGAYGDQERQGIDLAIEEINAKGGINGHKLVAVHEDDQMDPTMATNAINKLITINKVPAVIGEISSSVTLAVAPIAERNRVVLITHFANSNAISNAGDYIFRTQITNAQEAQYLVKLASSLNLTDCAILYSNSDFGTDLSQSISENFTKNGGTVLISEGYNPDATDFRTQLTKIQAKNPSAIFLIGYLEMGTALKQAKELGIKSQFILPDTINEDPQFLEMAGNAADGVMYVYPPTEGPKWQEFNQKVKSKYGGNATTLIAMAYDTTNVLAAAMEKSGYTADEIKNGLYQIKDYPGVMGNITFDKNGDDISRTLVFKIVKGGKFVDYGA